MKVRVVQPNPLKLPKLKLPDLSGARAGLEKTKSWIVDHKWWVVGGAAAAITGVAIVASLSSSNNSSCGACTTSCPNGTCDKGYVCRGGYCVGAGGSSCNKASDCINGQTCIGGACTDCAAIGDYPPNSNGQCAQGSAMDPNNPGCCKNTCPDNCTSADRCRSGCGPSYTCADGSCQPIQSVHTPNPVITVAPTLGVVYTQTDCYYVVCKCLKCALGFQWLPTSNTSITFLDNFNQPVPGIHVYVQQVTGSYANIVSIKGGSGSPYAWTTDANGNISIGWAFNGVMSDIKNLDNAIYECGSCYNGEGYYANIPYSSTPIATIVLTVVEWPNTFVEIQVAPVLNINGSVNNGLGGCPCL